MSDSYVTLKDLAKEFGRDRGGLRRWILKHPILKHEITLLRVRPPGNASGTPSHAFSLEDADRIRKAREDDGFGSEFGCNGDPITSTFPGWFYVVQPIPEFSETRIKLGFTLDIKQRLASYRTICPQATVLKSWPCRAIWELTAIASISREGCTILGQEVFQCDDINLLIDRADTFFKLMPSLDTL